MDDACGCRWNDCCRGRGRGEKEEEEEEEGVSGVGVVEGIDIGGGGV